MIIDAFKTKIFPIVPTGFENDEEPPRDEDKEENQDDRLPRIKEEEEALEKIAAVDNILEPGLVKRYFKDDSSMDMFEQLRNIVKHQRKISAKKIQMTLIEAGLEN